MERDPPWPVRDLFQRSIDRTVTHPVYHSAHYHDGR